jgi:hypothetical protein
VIGAVEEIDLEAFYADYRPDGHGRPGYEPSMMVALCARAGLVSTGVVAIDGTKLHTDASREANSDYERIAREIVAEARATTRPRTSSTARRAATSCPRSSPRRRGGAGGCATPGAASTSSAPKRPGRSRARGRRG